MQLKMFFKIAIACMYFVTKEGKKCELVGVGGGGEGNGTLFWAHIGWNIGRKVVIILIILQFFLGVCLPVMFCII